MRMAERIPVSYTHLDVYKRQGLDDAVREQLRLYIEAKNYPALNDLLDTFGSRHEAGVLKQLPRLFGGDGVFPEAEALLEGTDAEQPLFYLRSLYSKLDELGLGDCVTVDLGIVNRTDYYTGIVFKGYIEGQDVYKRQVSSVKSSFLGNAVVFTPFTPA